jgi:zinc transport system ATP-binding protein
VSTASADPRNTPLLHGATLAGPEVTFRRVGLTLGATRVLDDVSFKVKAGAIHAVIGPNGGGKTSLVRSLLGQMPHNGEIRIAWAGERRVGYVPQSIAFDPTLPITVDDFMAILCQRRPAFFGTSKRHRAQITAALEAVGVAEKRSRQLGQLSGGERQRVLFAQALIPLPHLLVLDEPMASVDREGGAVIEELIRALQAAGATIVWIHHDLKLLGEIANAVTCVNRRVVFSGPTAEMLTPERILDMFAGAAE